MKIPRTGQRRRSGFTLVEMVVVLFIVIIFLAMSIPFFANFSGSTGLTTSVREVGTILRTARSYAVAGTYNISGNSNVNAVFDTSVTPNTYRITDSSGATKDKTYQLTKGVSFSGATTTVTFTPNGGLTSTSDTSVTITSAKGSKQITVDAATGAVTIP